MIRIKYKVLTKENFVFEVPEEQFENETEARTLWNFLKSVGFAVNMEWIDADPVRHVVNVEYTKNGTPYTFETPVPVRKGDWVIVTDRYGDPIIVTAVSGDHDEKESDIAKRFPLERLKTIVGVVKKVA